MHHHHNHHHEHSAVAATQSKKILIAAIVINLLFSLIEAATGIFAGSLGLVSDAGHNLSDTFGLGLALVAIYLGASKSYSSRYTYGYRKASILIALTNAIILLATVAVIVIESIRKISRPESLDLNPTAISYTALAAIFVNGFTTWLLSKGNRGELNNRGAFLHMLADTLVSVGVLASGIVIGKTGLAIIDPIISLVIAAVILAGTCSLLKDSIKMSIDAVPEGIDIDDIKSRMVSVGGVRDVHHVHIWPISTTETALTAHIVLDGLDNMNATVREVKSLLKDCGIVHSTIEVETDGTGCSEVHSGHDCTCHCCD